jgi:hypothetical protein
MCHVIFAFTYKNCVVKLFLVGMFENELKTPDVKLPEQQLFYDLCLCVKRIKNYMHIFFYISSFIRGELSSMSHNVIVKCI